MDKNKLVTYVIAALTILALAAAVFLTYRPNTTMISYDGSQTSDGSSSDKSSRSKKSTSKSNPKSSSGTSKTASGSSSKRDTVPEDPHNSTQTSNNGQSGHTPSIGHTPSGGQPPEGSESENPPSPSSEPTPSETPSQEQEFREKIKRKLNQIQAGFGISVKLIAPSFASDPKFSGYSSLSTAYTQLIQLEACFKAVGSKAYHGLSRRGFSLSVILAETNLLDSEPVALHTNGNSLSFEIQSHVSGWNHYFYKSSMSLFDYAISVQGSLDQAYESFSALNPDDFAYGRYLPQYINSAPQTTYFISIEGQMDISSDRGSLYVADLLGLFPNIYHTPACPAYRKIQRIQQDLSSFIY